MRAAAPSAGSPRRAVFGRRRGIADKVAVTANGQKLKIVDPSATIQRYACTGCGVHMYGRIENKGHPFHGLDFIHVELSKESGWEEPRFALLSPRSSSPVQSPSRWAPCARG